MHHRGLRPGLHKDSTPLRQAPRTGLPDHTSRTTQQELLQTKKSTGEVLDKEQERAEKLRNHHTLLQTHRRQVRGPPPKRSGLRRDPSELLLQPRTD